MTKRTAGFRATLALLGVVSMTQAPTVQAAAGPHVRALNFAMVGLAAGQTARLNVVNACPSDPSLPPNPYRVELSFLGPDGSVVTGRDGHEFRLLVALAAGQSAFLDLDASALEEFALPAVQRVQIRASVLVSGRCARGVENPTTIPSLELFDNATGRTTIFAQPGSTRFFKEVDPGPAR